MYSVLRQASERTQSMLIICGSNTHVVTDFGHDKELSESPQCDNTTYKFEHVPVEDIVVGEALSVEEVPEELAEVRVVGLVVEPQRATEVQVGGKLRCVGRRERQSSHTR